MQAAALYDGYKLSHKGFMQPKTTSMCANLTARNGERMTWMADKKAVFFSLQAFIKGVLIREFNETFFNLPKASAIGRLNRTVTRYLGPGKVSMKHFEELHDLGFLPLSIRALPEGSRVPLGVPMITWRETDPRFAWLVTLIETVLSCEVWGPIQSATTAAQFLALCNRFADETCGNRNHVPFQCHDFSFRGMFGRYAAAMSGAAHLLSFVGTDTVPALDWIDDYYGGFDENTLIGTSVPASEHSVTSLGIEVKGEVGTIRDWITRAYPTGIVSVVSDTIDYWKVIAEILPSLEKEIRARKSDGVVPGKVVVRPDSGDPARIICGYRPDEVRVDVMKTQREGDGEIEYVEKYTVKAAQACDEYEITEDEFKGSIEVLWEKFGGTVNGLGYRELDPCIGLIYGDSITLSRALEIFQRLQQRGFASNNVVFGVGSFTYQYVTRDTLSMAVKATSAVVDGKDLMLSKDPKTAGGSKKSARGRMVVNLVDGEYVMTDGVSAEVEAGGELREVFRDGALLIDEDFVTIRNRVQGVVPKEEDGVEGEA